MAYMQVRGLRLLFANEWRSINTSSLPVKYGYEQGTRSTPLSVLLQHHASTPAHAPKRRAGLADAPAQPRAHLAVIVGGRRQQQQARQRGHKDGHRQCGGRRNCARQRAPAPNPGVVRQQIGPDAVVRRPQHARCQRRAPAGPQSLK